MSMNRPALAELLVKISEIRVGIIGDFCLDAYLMLDPSASEISIETGLQTTPVKVQRYSLGGAGNVANNLLAMGVRHISVFGVVGQDPFGKEMLTIFSALGVDSTGLLVQGDDWYTHTYVKPYERNQEKQRIDFGNFNQLHPEVGRELLERLEGAIPGLDVVIINEQVRQGIHDERFQKALTDVVLRHPEILFIVDSRHHSDRFKGTIRKIRLQEALGLLGRDGISSEVASPTEIESLCRELHRRWGKPFFLTRGEHGCVVYDGREYREIPGLLIVSPIDSVGAGDSMLAGIAAALAAGETPLVAAELGTYIAGVTVQKLFQTGTASPEEILAIGSDPDFRYKPELARQPHKAVYHAGTEIEVVTSLPQSRTFTHCIFDQDGTLSTLRQGWEEIMEPMMVRAILGKSVEEVDEALHREVHRSVRDYIEKTTGVQTLVQMKGLVDLVRRFGLVPAGEIRDEFEYKRIYNDELLAMVNDRIQRLKSGELDTVDFLVKKALQFLQILHSRGLELYLASGTDQADLEREAEILGYRGLFQNRIYGSVGDIRKDAKKIVLERILNDIGSRAAENVVAFGDGPVEMRETRKKGGYAVGVASNEIRRHGLNLDKRRRLIEAGADLIIADFSQMERLVSLMFGTEGPSRR
jgi:rfaE bifunctional protein kinase chain/domain